MTTDSSDPKYQPGDAPGPAGWDDDVIISEDTHRENRIPPGQTRTRKWPVLHASTVPRVSLDDWTFEVRGLVKNPFKVTWDEFQQLPRVKVFADFHCVTTWSRLGNLWEGVSIKALLEKAEPLPEAKFVVAEGYDFGWTTNLPLADLDDADVLVADRHDGEPIDADHGGPLRLIVPKLYAWKSAKWLKAIELTADNKPGFWERGGYHDHGDPWVVSPQHPDGERFRR